MIVFRAILFLLRLGSECAGAFRINASQPSVHLALSMDAKLTKSELAKNKTNQRDELNASFATVRNSTVESDELNASFATLQNSTVAFIKEHSHMATVSHQADNPANIKNGSLWTSRLVGNHSLVGISSSLDLFTRGACHGRPVKSCASCFKDKENCNCDRPQEDRQEDDLGYEDITRVECGAWSLGPLGCGRSGTVLGRKLCTRNPRGLARIQHAPEELSITSWNVAAVNTNPFEFWAYDEDYNSLMESFDDIFAGKSALGKVLVNSVFTEAMMKDLGNLMGKVGRPAFTTNVGLIFKDTVSKQTVSEFLKQFEGPEFSAARWISWPDRTIAKVGKEYRPSVVTPCIEGFGEKEDKLETWWKSWKHFMFEGTKDGSPAIQKIAELDESYHANVKPQDLVLNVEKQVMYLAIFDALYVHLMFELNSDWVTMKRKMVDSVVNKNDKTKKVLFRHIERKKPDIICLQETGKDLVDTLQNQLRDYTLYKPFDFVDAKPQNSILLLRKDTFDADQTKEVTHNVNEAARMPNVKQGDLVTVLAKHAISGADFVISSFHGKSDGKSTFEVIPAVVKYNEKKHAGAGFLLFGMDANTFQPDKKNEADIPRLLSELGAIGMATAWGDTYDPKWITTKKARTAVQVQLDKRVASDKLKDKADTNPKDHILHETLFMVKEVSRDNTGTGGWNEGMFPSADFPSDHAMVFAKICRRAMNQYMHTQAVVPIQRSQSALPPEKTLMVRTTERAKTAPPPSTTNFYSPVPNSDREPLLTLNVPQS